MLREVAKLAEPVVERFRVSLERVERQRGGHERGVEQLEGVRDGEGEIRGHQGGAVDQRDPFLLGEIERDDSVVDERRRRREPRAVRADELPLADQREGDVGERGEVAGRPDRPLGGDVTDRGPG